VTQVAPQTPVILSQVSLLRDTKHILYHFVLPREHTLWCSECWADIKGGSEQISSDSLGVKKSNFQMHYLKIVVCFCLLLAKECRMCYCQ
jgi:hypothetical protein